MSTEGGAGKKDGSESDETRAAKSGGVTSETNHGINFGLAGDDVRGGVLQVARDVLDKALLRSRVEYLLPERTRLLKVN